MAIIYTYPIKNDPSSQDTLLISDVEDGNKTKQVTVSKLIDLVAGVSTFSAGTTGLTPNTSSNGAITLAGTLNVANGGTGATNLTGILKGNGASAITSDAGLGDLSNVSYPGTNDSSMYIGNGAPGGLIGTPTKNTTVGEGAGEATSSGESNTLIGTNSGAAITTGSDNVILGSDANSNAGNVNAAIAVGRNTVVSTGSVAVGDSASATGGGVALGRGATNTVANLALGSATYPLLFTNDPGDVNGLGTAQSPAKFIEVQIGEDKYYMALYEQA